MIRRLLALSSSPYMPGALGLALITIGLALVHKATGELTDRIDQLHTEMQDREARLVARMPAYPAPADLDPLGRGDAGDVDAQGDAAAEPVVAVLG
ncbi:MAG TPA: hypothetical protein VHA75_01065 [Rugosimonospora sp.]|nr:hypothetical protein [Rugosimonospora sp.]